jgi:hypothetical protein
MDKLAEEQNMHDTSRDHLFTAEKRASTYRAELEESKALLERVSYIFNIDIFPLCNLMIFKFL